MDDVRQTTTAIAAGDSAAFARLYSARFDFVFAVARRCTGLDESACLDLVQDTMIRVIRSIKPLADEHALDAWLTRVTRSAAYDHLRRERRLRRREAAAVRESAGAIAGADRPSSTAPIGAALDPADSDARLAWLKHELAATDRAAAELLDLRYRAGMTLESIGARVGLKPGAVHGRINRLLSSLRERAKEDFDE